MDVRQLMVFRAMEEVLNIYAATELGSTAELNMDAIAAYMDGVGCLASYFDCKTHEDCCEVITQQILSGYPVWQLLNIPEWTKQQLQKEYDYNVEEARKQFEAQYICFKCEYLCRSRTSAGENYSCRFDRMTPRDEQGKRIPLPPRSGFALKKRCKHFEKCKQYEAEGNQVKNNAEVEGDSNR